MSHQQPPPQPPGPSYPGQPPQGPPPKKKHTGRNIFIGIGAFIVLIIIISVAASGGGGKSSTTSSQTSSPPAAAPASQAPPAPSAAAPSPTPSHPDTVTFIVSGSTADVTYGPAGSDLSGAVPMDKTMTIPGHAPIYYSISAQLQGGGDVSCKIEVDGKVIATGEAQGGYNISQCEIGQDPMSGNWESDNS